MSFYKVQLLFCKKNPDSTKYKYENLCNDIFRVISFSKSSIVVVVVLLSNDIHSHQFEIELEYNALILAVILLPFFSLLDISSSSNCPGMLICAGLTC